MPIAFHRRTRVAARWIAWLASWLLWSSTGCIDADFARASQVQTRRVLAIVVEPPVAGTDVRPTFSPLVVDADGTALAPDTARGVHFEWTACLVPETVPGLAGMQYDADGNQQGCGGAPEIALDVDEATGVATLGAGLLSQAVSDAALDQVARLLGLPPALLRQAMQRTGVIVTVQLRVVDAVKEPVVAFKRIVLVDRPQAEVIGNNPPPPRFSLRRAGDDPAAGAWISARHAGDPMRCAWEASPLSIQTGGVYVLDPVDVPDVDQGEMDWREDYEVIDLQGNFSTLTERAYYAWFSTAGTFDQEQTTAPADEEIWRAPSEPGRYPLWLAVRDGHAGMSACRMEIDVVAAP